ncbi:MAG: methyltransferase domain-containing protein [Clostridia bacterium]|nr:methyltransferase domain-containing protein [Clostridia bacterium]
MFDEWNNVAEAWNKNMKDGDWFQRNIIYPEILRLLVNTDKKKIIDVGCGNGHLSRFLTIHGAQMLGVDNSQQMLKCCKAYNSDIKYEQLDITDDTFPYEDCFDVAIFNNSMQDMEKYTNGLSNAYRILKKNGHLLIVVKHPCFHGRSDECGWRVTTEDGDTFTTGHGLTELEKNKSNYTADFFLINDYLNKSEHTREWYGLKTTSYARTLQDYINTVIQAGFTIKSISEPSPIPEGQAENPSLYELLTRIPNFIFIYSEKKQ